MCNNENISLLNWFFFLF